jgi:hypothetical protein
VPPRFGPAGWVVVVVVVVVVVCVGVVIVGDVVVRVVVVVVVVVAGVVVSPQPIIIARSNKIAMGINNLRIFSGLLLNLLCTKAFITL